jgi:hypothetical protein
VRVTGLALLELAMLGWTTVPDIAWSGRWFRLSLNAVGRIARCRGRRLHLRRKLCTRLLRFIFFLHGENTPKIEGIRVRVS